MFSYWQGMNNKNLVISSWNVSAASSCIDCILSNVPLSFNLFIRTIELEIQSRCNHLISFVESSAHRKKTVASWLLLNLRKATTKKSKEKETGEWGQLQEINRKCGLGLKAEQYGTYY